MRQHGLGQFITKRASRRTRIGVFMVVSRRVVVRSLCALTLVLGCVPVTSAQQPAAANGSVRRSVPAARMGLEERITLDGRLDEPVWSARRPGGRLHPDRSRQRPAGHRADRGPHRLRPRRALHGRHRLRLRAGQVARLPAAPRRVPRLRRPLHVDDRHVPRRADRLLLRDEPVGPDGRLAVRRQRRQPRSGTASGTRASAAARSAGRSRSRSPSAR